jgi:predicted RND superfamily exporter protein
MAPDWLVDRMVRARHGLLLLAIFVAVAAAWLAPRLKFDRSVENMFPPESPLLASYQKLKRTFGGNEIILAVYHDPQLFAPDGAGIDRVSSIAKRLRQVDGVKAVLSIDQPLPADLMVSNAPLARRTRELFRGYTHGADGHTVSIVCMLFPEQETTVSRRQTIDQLRGVMHSLPGPIGTGWLTGEPILVVDGFRYVEQDGRRLGLWATLLLGGTIIVCFRSLRWVVIPLLVVQWALLATRALLVLARIELSMVSSMLTAIVMVVGVATMVHIMVRYGELRHVGHSPLESLRQTLRQLIVPITWACLTDAVGFLALAVSDVGPVRDFGVMMAMGSLMVLVSVVLLVPGLTILGRFDPDPRQPWGEGQLTGGLQQLLGAVSRRPYRVLGVAAILTAAAVAGIGRLQVETDFTRNFRQNSEIARAYNYVEDHLGGAGVCDVVIPAPESLNWAFLQRVYRLGQTLCPPEGASDPKLVAITNSFSVADALIELSPVNIANRPRLLQHSLVFSGLATMRNWMPEFYGALYGQDPQSGQHYLRLMLRVHERQDAVQKLRLIERLESVSRQEFPQAEVTGYFVLLSHLIHSVLRDQWTSFTAAVAGIALLMTIAFRDLRLVAIALVPNAFPVLIVLGAMGWASALLWPELKINMGTAMIAAVSMGLSIDSSIHYILGFRQLVHSGMDFDEALQQIHRRVGKAVVLSTLALAVGFTTLATSRFVPTVYFGVLVTLAMLGGLIGNLIGLPLLIHLYYRPRGSTVTAARGPVTDALSVRSDIR